MSWRCVVHLGKPAAHNHPLQDGFERLEAALGCRKGKAMVDDDPEIESSPLSRSVAEDGITVRVEICRLVGKDERWLIEVVDHEGSSTVWSDTFASDLEANIEFHRTLEMEGITRRNRGAIAHHHLLPKIRRSSASTMRKHSSISQASAAGQRRR